MKTKEERELEEKIAQEAIKAYYEKKLEREKHKVKVRDIQGNVSYFLLDN